MVNMISIHNATMLTSPRIGDLNPKNDMDQRKLSASCAPKKYTAVFTFFFFRSNCHMRKNDTPIIKYNRVQTGPKIQLGGEKGGLMRYAYHPPMAAMVNGVDTIPTSSHSAMETISTGKFFIVPRKGVEPFLLD